MWQLRMPSVSYNGRTGNRIFGYCGNHKNLHRLKPKIENTKLFPLDIRNNVMQIWLQIQARYAFNMS